MEKVYVMAARRRSAFALCREYGISVEEIAPVVGVSEPRFLRGYVSGRHRDSGLSPFRRCRAPCYGNGTVTAVAFPFPECYRPTRTARHIDL